MEIDSSSGGADNIFLRLADDILQSAEKLTIRLEEGWNAMMTGSSVLPSESQQPEDWLDEAETAMMDEDSPLNGIAESVLGDILRKQSAPRTFQENLDAFRHAITWSEPFIVGLLLFQVFMFVMTCYVCRRNVNLVPRIIFMIWIAALVRSAEWLNRWAGSHWDQFCTQNYFDPRGVFISIFLCAPLLLDSFIMLVAFLREASHLLVQVKTAQLIQQKQKRKKPSKSPDKLRGKKDR